MIRKYKKRSATSFLIITSLLAFLFFANSPALTIAQSSSTQVFYVA